LPLQSEFSATLSDNPHSVIEMVHDRPGISSKNG